MPTQPISHAFVVPDKDFQDWFAVLRPYLKAFERVVVVRSPAGNDLNRYRNVTAIQAPLTWFQDDAHAHVRRIYPSVVMIDIIKANTPQELAPILQQRVSKNDRYGEKDNNPAHIFSRFVLEWATTFRPMGLKNTFSDVPRGSELNESIDIFTKVNEEVICAARGTVSNITKSPNKLGYRRYLQVTSQHEGRTYITTYEGIKTLKVSVGQAVEVGDSLALCAEDTLRIIVQNPPNGVALFKLPNVINPINLLYIQELRLRPTADGLRVRSLPSTDGTIVGQIYTWDLIEPLESHGRVIEKAGVNNKWIKVRLSDGKEGYSAAWYMDALTKSDASSVFPGVNAVGVNLDIRHPLGKPNPARLGGMGWVRFGYNVSNNTGSEDINAALARYLPLMEAYRKAGYHIIFTTSHQTYGEGKIQFWPWHEMNDSKWIQLIDRFADMMSGIAKQWAGRDLVTAWQVWNEQDAPIGATSSVPMLAHNYTRMFARVYQAIRSADPNVLILTGGFTGGPGNGANYARQLVENLPSSAIPDGIAFHPYGRGVDNHPIYARFGHIDEEVKAYSGIMPDKPLWITEWGVLDRPADNPDDINHYASQMINYVTGKFPSKIAAMIWYAWAQGMHNGYGLVDSNDNPRPPLIDTFLKS